LIENYIQVSRVLSMLGTSFYDSGARSIIDPKQAELLQDFELMETTNDDDDNNDVNNNENGVWKNDEKSEREQQFEQTINNLKISRFANEESIFIEKEQEQQSNNNNNYSNQNNNKNTCDLTLDVFAFKPEVAAKIMQLFQQYMKVSENFLQSYANYSASSTMITLSQYGKQKNHFIYKNIEQFLLSSDLIQELRKFFELYHEMQQKQEKERLLSHNDFSNHKLQ